MWKGIDGPKCLFFESESYLFMKHKEEVFDFITTLIRDYDSEGVVVFKFIKMSIDEGTELQLKYCFDMILNWSL